MCARVAVYVKEEVIQADSVARKLFHGKFVFILAKRGIYFFVSRSKLVFNSHFDAKHLKVSLIRPSRGQFCLFSVYLFVV